MTFDDDYLHINFSGGVKRVTCKSAGVSWPPPEQIELFGFNFNRVRYSKISDDDRAAMTHVVRGAEYDPVAP